MQSLFAYAQLDRTDQSVEMADELRSEGKIYVVVAIILVILIGFFVYLFLLDRRIGKLERQLGIKNSKN